MGSLHLDTGSLVVGSIISQKAPSRANHTQVGWHRTNQSSYTLALWPGNLEVKGFSYSKLCAHQPSPSLPTHTLRDSGVPVWQDCPLLAKQKSQPLKIHLYH